MLTASHRCQTHKPPPPPPADGQGGGIRRRGSGGGGGSGICGLCCFFFIIALILNVIFVVVPANGGTWVQNEPGQWTVRWDEPRKPGRRRPNRITQGEHSRYDPHERYDSGAGYRTVDSRSQDEL